MYQLQVDDIPPKFTLSKLEAHFSKFNKIKANVNKVLYKTIELVDEEKMQNGS